MILIIIVGMSLMVFCYVYDDLNHNSGKTAEQGQQFTVGAPYSEADVEISIDTDARIPPKFYIISEDKFREISPTRAVPNEAVDPSSVKQIEQASVYHQYGKVTFNFEGSLENDNWYVLVVTNQTEGGIAFNMKYEISVYSFRPLVLPFIFVPVFIMEILVFVYIIVINSRLKRVQEKISTQRLLKAQMDMVRNFILQSSGAGQSFGMSASPYLSESGEGVPRDGIPLAMSSPEMEIVECYACNELITVNSPERPLIVACPNCGVKSQVVEDDEAEEKPDGIPDIKSTLPPAKGETKMLPAGNPPPEGADSPPPSPAPTPAPTPSPAPEE